MNGLIVSVVINIFSSIIYDVVGKGINLESKKLKQIKENAKQSVSRELARMQEQSRIFDTDAMQSYLKNMKPIEQIFQYVFLWTLLHYRRQLEHITNEDHLFASEWHIVPECLAHGVINGIHNIASYHRYLIDDDGVCME